MAYATPARFVQEFGLREATQLLADEQNLLTAELLVAAIQEQPYPPETPDDAQAATADALQRLVRKLDNVSNLMDGYLRSAITLPIASGDVNVGTLEECCLALSRAGLADDSDNWTERMEKLADRWTAWLKDVSTGKAQLVVPGAPEEGSAFRVRSGQAQSRYDWTAFERSRR